MINRLMIAGFGGQGVMMIGKLIGECAICLLSPSPGPQDGRKIRMPPPA